MRDFEEDPEEVEVKQTKEKVMVDDPRTVLR